MGKIIRAKVKIKGLRPLLQHRFGPDALPLEKQEVEGPHAPGHVPSEWKRTCMVTPDGQLYLDPTYIFSALRNGAKYTKKGKGSLQVDVSATLQVTDDIILLNRHLPEDVDNDKTKDVYIDIAGVRNPSTKQRNVRYRLATRAGWECEFNLLWDSSIVDRTRMETVCIDTGTLVGLADGRSIGFGRFEVLSFEVIE